MTVQVKLTTNEYVTINKCTRNEFIVQWQNAMRDVTMMRGDDSYAINPYQIVLVKEFT